MKFAQLQLPINGFKTRRHAFCRFVLNNAERSHDCNKLQTEKVTTVMAQQD